ncbi:MAG: OsmC family protein [Streptosporangiaceae bacterium]
MTSTEASSTEASAPAPVVEISTVQVFSAPGRVKNVRLPVDDDVLIPMGLHGGVAEHYHAPSDIEPHATTLDYLVGVTAACLSGTLGGMLRALGQSTEPDHFATTGTGTIVNDRGVLRIAAVHISYTVSLSEKVPAEKVEKAHDRHVRHCPIAKTIGGCVAITTSLTMKTPDR